MPGIFHNIYITTPPEVVYENLTSRQGLAGWWTPNTNSGKEVNDISRFGFGDGYYKEMKIVELITQELVKWVCLNGAKEWIGTNISFILEHSEAATILAIHPEIKDQFQQSNSTRTGTLLTLRHDDWKEFTPMFAECNYTWALFLRSLKLLSETGRGRPWPNQHSDKE